MKNIDLNDLFYSIIIIIGVLLLLVLPLIFLSLITCDSNSSFEFAVKYLLGPSIILSYLIIYKWEEFLKYIGSRILQFIFFIIAIPFLAFVSLSGDAYFINKYIGTQTKIFIEGKVNKKGTRNGYTIEIVDKKSQQAYEFEIEYNEYKHINEKAPIKYYIKKGSLGIYYK